MQTFKNTYIKQPSFLKVVEPCLWLELFEKYRKDFNNLPLALPSSTDDFDDDVYNKLAEVLSSLETTSVSQDFIDLLQAIESFGQNKVSDISLMVQTIAEECGVEAAFLKRNNLAPEAEIEELNLFILLLQDEEHNGRRRIQAYLDCTLCDRNSFFYFEAPQYTGSFETPTQEDCNNLASLFKRAYKEPLKIMEDYCVISRISRPYTYEMEEGEEMRGEEWWFRVQRSNRAQVINRVKKSKVSRDTIIPEMAEIIVFNPVTRLMRTNVVSKHRRKIYLEHFSKLLTGKKLDFTPCERYTFEPLEKEGWTDVFDSKENQSLSPDAKPDYIYRVNLREVRCEPTASNTIIHKIKPNKTLANQDVHERKKMNLPDYFSNIKKVFMEFAFREPNKRQVVVSVRIFSSNQIAIDKTEYTPAIMHWLGTHGFILPPADEADVMEQST